MTLHLCHPKPELDIPEPPIKRMMHGRRYWAWRNTRTVKLQFEFDLQPSEWMLMWQHDNDFDQLAVYAVLGPVGFEFVVTAGVRPLDRVWERSHARPFHRRVADAVARVPAAWRRFLAGGAG